MLETDLYPPVKKFLEAQGYEVKAEIKDCDVVGLRDGEPPVVVELKVGFSLQLVLQGIDRQAVTDTVYLAIAAPKRRQSRDVLELCRRLGLGLISVHNGACLAELDPKPYRPRPHARRKGLLLKEFQARVGDPNRGGSTRRPLVTHYRQDALRCLRCLAAGPRKVKEIRAEARVGRAAGILQSDVYGWFQREQRGIYTLSPKGLGALTTYADQLPAL